MDAPPSPTSRARRPELVEAVRRLGAATVAAELGHMGVRDPHIHGPLALTPGKCIAGPAVTLQCMPKREDLVEFGEHADPEAQLHRQVLLHAAAGDVVVVDARGDMGSGIFGEMMLTYFKGKGGAGLVIDGCIRDWPQVKPLDFPSGSTASRPISTPRPASCPSRSTSPSPAAACW